MNKSLEILLEVLMWIVSLEEFNHENVLLLLIQRVLHVVKEFGNTDVVVLQELLVKGSLGMHQCMFRSIVCEAKGRINCYTIGERQMFESSFFKI